MIGLSQEDFLAKVLTKFNMHNSKKGFIRMQDGISLRKT